MSLPHALSQHLRDVHFGGNWTSVNLKDTLAGTTWQDATQVRDEFNTVGALAYHIHYYVATLLRVLQGGPLDAHDRFSFAHPPFTDPDAWRSFLERCWRDAEAAADLVAALPEPQLWQPFTDPKYGTYYRNIQGIIEHAHYHLGQIVLLLKGLPASP